MKEQGSTDVLRFTASDDVRAWLDAVRHHVDDLDAAARDATARYSRRVLSRREARKRSTGAARALRELLAAADRGLAPEGAKP